MCSQSYDVRVFRDALVNGKASASSLYAIAKELWNFCNLGQIVYITSVKSD